MPPVLEAISDVLPLSYAVDAMQHLVRPARATAEVWRDLAVVAAFALAGAGPRRGDPAAAYAVDSPLRAAAAVRRSLCGMSLLRQPLLLLARSDKVKKLVSAMPVSAGIVRSYVPGETTEAAVEATAGWSTTASGSPSTSSARTPSTPSRPTPRSRPTSTCSQQLSARGPDPQRRGLGEAVRDRPGAARATATRSPSRTPARSAARPATPAPRSPSTWRTTPPPTRRWRSCASCARTSPRPARCSRPTCTAPRPTAARWPTRARGSGCARAPTTSPSRSPSRTGSTSTSPTCAASRC